MDDIIIRVAARVGIDVDLVRAIAAAESGYNQWAVRYEPGWSYLYFAREYADKLLITYETEVVLQSCSWGPMQVMGSVARELGFTGELPKLTDPELGILYGATKLKALQTRYGDEMQVISAYNAGSPRRTPGGLFENQTYVDRVYGNLLKLRKIS